MSRATSNTNGKFYVFHASPAAGPNGAVYSYSMLEAAAAGAAAGVAAAAALDESAFSEPAAPANGTYESAAIGVCLKV